MAIAKSSSGSSTTAVRDAVQECEKRSTSARECGAVMGDKRFAKARPKTSAAAPNAVADGVGVGLHAMLGKLAYSSRCVEGGRGGDLPYFLGRRRPLLYRACKEIFPLERRERRVLWSWVSGNLPNEEFFEKFHV